ncbi:uncharacterized protein LOC132049016 [Lycium ferocissimum]|uniref:uncharacterized protein LOC132049016 n=1 Tax=Lycium ferocissimum TaxID=112874 RepID=UPI0028163073|nr:uncharacterized protein LOC132049016 [Lycium ferocissimum]
MSDSGVFSRQISFIESINQHQNTNFKRDRDKQLDKVTRKAKGLLYKLDLFPKEKMQSDKTKAFYQYLKGFLLEVVSPYYNSEAEDQLEQALELDEKLLEAYITRGNCCLKLGRKDLSRAKDCFDYVFKEDPNRKDVFRMLAMHEIRMLEENGGDIAKGIVDECIGHANIVVSMSANDGISLCKCDRSRREVKTF